MTHHLKTWPSFFSAVKEGFKTFEIRKNDRGFQLKDILILQEYDPKTEKFSGRELKCLVIYTLEGGLFGLEKDHIAMGIVIL